MSVDRRRIPKYTPEQDGVIRDGYHQERRVRLIAQDLGVTKNAVLGRANRLRLCDPQYPPRKSSQP